MYAYVDENISCQLIKTLGGEKYCDTVDGGGAPSLK